MKSLIAVLLLSLAEVSSVAQPARYDFSGQVTSISRDGAGSIAALGWAVGDPVAVSFELDFLQPGRVRLNDGWVEVLEPVVWDEGRIDYFSARMLSGTLLPEVDGGMYNDPESASEYLTGWNRSDWRGNRGVLIGGSQDSHIRLERFDPWPGGMADWRVQDWVVGSTLQGYVTGFSELDYSMMLAEFRLDAITPVPEPGSHSLVWLGGAIALLARGWRATEIATTRECSRGLSKLAGFRP